MYLVNNLRKWRKVLLCCLKRKDGQDVRNICTLAWPINNIFFVHLLTLQIAVHETLCRFTIYPIDNIIIFRFGFSATIVAANEERA